MKIRKFTVSPLLLHATEANVQATIEEMAQWYGYLSWHDNFSRRNYSGWPDLALIGTKVQQMVFFEVKREAKAAKPSVEQVHWIRSIRATGVHSYVVKPSDMDLIEHILLGDVPFPQVGDGSPPEGYGFDKLLAYEDNPVTIHRKPKKKRRRKTS